MLCGVRRASWRARWCANLSLPWWEDARVQSCFRSAMSSPDGLVPPAPTVVSSPSFDASSPNVAAVAATVTIVAVLLVITVTWLALRLRRARRNNPTTARRPASYPSRPSLAPSEASSRFGFSTYVLPALACAHPPQSENHSVSRGAPRTPPGTLQTQIRLRAQRRPRSTPPHTAQRRSRPHLPTSPVHSARAHSRTTPRAPPPHPPPPTASALPRLHTAARPGTTPGPPHPANPLFASRYHSHALYISLGHCYSPIWIHHHPAAGSLEVAPTPSYSPCFFHTSLSIFRCSPSILLQTRASHTPQTCRLATRIPFGPSFSCSLFFVTPVM